MTEVITINEVIHVVKVTEPKVQVVTVGTQGPPGTGGDIDHASLNGLEADDHPQYHTDARGDVRYYTKAQVDAGLAGKANAAHGHSVADVAGLQAALDAKANTTHGHSIADVTGLQSALDSKAAGVHGHSIAEVAGLQAALDAKASTSHGHSIAEVAGLQTALDAKADQSAIPNTAQAQVDFGHATGGESNFARASVSAAWVASGSVILCAVGSGSVDHDPEDGALEGITATACNLVEGSGFDVIAHAPGGSWGRYNINIMGL
jgi:hypothetical protein